MATKLGEILLQERKVTEDELKLGLDLQSKNPQVRLGAILKQLHFVDSKSIAIITAQQYRMPFHSGRYTTNLDVISHLRNEKSFDVVHFLREHKVFPLKDGLRPVFVLAHADNTKATDILRNDFGLEDAEFRIGVESEIDDALDVLALEESRKRAGSTLVEIDEITTDESLKRWFEKMISKAVMYRSTDIHIEPTPLGVQIRFRIDGKLRIACCLDRTTINPLSNIVLIKCGKDPSAFHDFHDGRFDHAYFDRCVDVRVSVVPCVHGPSLVLRLLDKEQASYSVQSLGYSDLNASLIFQAVAKPHGIILVTGPTGCGKSTTLTSILDDLINTEKKVMTVEDPIERVIAGGTQVQVEPHRNITFASSIRSFLRQDPDIMLVGEIRDEETAQEAIRAAATGHLIFSTLHTNNPVSAILRLLDLGVSRVNISNNIIAIISQRLVRKLCPNCKKEAIVYRDKVTQAEKQYLEEEYERVYFPQGCDKCFNGYRGRTVVAEILLVNDGLRDLIDQNKINEIACLLRAREDYRDIKSDARRLIKAGVTSLEEITSHLG